MNKEIDIITELIKSSNGTPIDIGLESLYSFKQVKKYTDIEIKHFEDHYSVVLPEMYKFLLKTIGASEIYSEENSHHSIEFHKLEDIYGIYEDCFENPKDWLFKKYLPVGYDNGLQESFGYSFYFKKPEQFFVLFHEYNLDELEEENDSEFPAYLCTFKEYVKEIVIKNGELEPH